MSDENDMMEAFVCFEHGDLFHDKEEAVEHFIGEHGMSEKEVEEEFEALASIWDD